MGMSFDCYFEYCEGVNISVQIFTWTYVFNSPGYVPKRGIVGSALLSFPPAAYEVPASPHPPHLLLPTLNTAVLEGVKQYTYIFIKPYSIFVSSFIFNLVIA